MPLDTGKAMYYVMQGTCAHWVQAEAAGGPDSEPFGWFDWDQSMNSRYTRSPAQIPNSSWLTALFVAGWLPFFLALAQVIRLQAAFTEPTRIIAFLPGWTAFAGRASEYGVNWLRLLSLSGGAALLSWGLWLECVGLRRLPAWSRNRWRILGGPAAAWALLVLWGLNLDGRYLHQDFWPVALFLHLPTLLVSYAVVGSGLRAVRSLGRCALLLLALWAVVTAAQLHFERPGRNDPEPWLILGGSLPLAAAVALRLGIWGWAEAPPVQPRAP